MSDVPVRPAIWARAASPDHPFGRLVLAARAHAELAAWRPATAGDAEAKRAIARISPAYTMVALQRLRRLLAHVDLLHAESVPGAIVECGTWRGGSLALIDWAFRRLGDPRAAWGFDSFAGLPPPGARDDAPAHRGFFDGWCTASPDEVHAAFRALGGSIDPSHLVTGWLEQTLPHAVTGPVALLNVDVDWYESVTTALEGLADHLSPRAIVNVDDYGRWGGCDRAVHDFLDRRGISGGVIQRTGRYGAWFRLPAA